MASLSCFMSSPGLVHHKTVARANKNFPVCAISGRNTGTAKASTSKRQNTSELCRVIPEGIDKSDLPPPPPFYHSIPVVGNLIEDALNISTDLSRAQKFDGIYSSDFYFERSENVTKYHAIIDILRDPDVFRSKDSFEPFIQLFGADSMLLLDAPHHAVLRSTVAPAFAPALFPFYFASIRDRTYRTWARVQQTVAKHGRALLDPIFRDHYLSAIIEMSTGIDMEGDGAEFICKNFLTMQNLGNPPAWGPLYNNAMKAKGEVLKILKGVVERRLVEKADLIAKLREYGDNLSFKASKDIKNGDVNVLLIAIARSDLKTGAGVKNDPKVIRSLCDLMLLIWFAGYATSASTTSCAAFEMGMDKDIWAQLAAEQDEMTANAGSQTVTYEQVSKMPLLDSFVSEMLRMHPAVSGTSRKTSKDVELLGHYVEAGSLVFCDFASAMRDETVYPDAGTLKVDRFVKKPGEPAVPRVLSFGGPGSPHYCLGGSLSRVLMKSVLAVVLREYRLGMDPKQSRKYSKVPEEVPKSKVVVTSVERRLSEAMEGSLA